MKVTIDRTGDDVHVSLERDPLPPERFKVVCKLVGAAIGGVVLLVAIRLVGTWAIGGAVLAQVFYGLYKMGE